MVEAGSDVIFRWTIDDKQSLTFHNVVFNVIYQSAAVFKLSVGGARGVELGDRRWGSPLLPIPLCSQGPHAAEGECGGLRPRCLAACPLAAHRPLPVPTADSLQPREQRHCELQCHRGAHAQDAGPPHVCGVARAAPRCHTSAGCRRARGRSRGRGLSVSSLGQAWAGWRQVLSSATVSVGRCWVGQDPGRGGDFSRVGGTPVEAADPPVQPTAAHSPPAAVAGGPSGMASR